MRPNIYKWGEIIKDVTTHTATRLHVQSVKRSYDLSHDQEKASIYTSKSTSDRRHDPSLEFAYAIGGRRHG